MPAGTKKISAVGKLMNWLPHFFLKFNTWIIYCFFIYVLCPVHFIFKQWILTNRTCLYTLTQAKASKKGFNYHLKEITINSLVCWFSACVSTLGLILFQIVKVQRHCGLCHPNWAKSALMISQTCFINYSVWRLIITESVMDFGTNLQKSLFFGCWYHYQGFLSHGGCINIVRITVTLVRLGESALKKVGEKSITTPTRSQTHASLLKRCVSFIVSMCT